MTGVVALFDSRDALLRAIDGARGRGLTPRAVFLPAYDPDVLHAAGAMRSWIPAWTLAGGVIGGALGLAFTIWVVQQWPVLRLGGKPLVSWPPFLIIAFELTVLLAALAAIAAFLLGCRRARRGVAVAYEPSMSDDQFGVLLACAADRAADVGEDMVRCGARLWRIV